MNARVAALTLPVLAVISACGGCNGSSPDAASPAPDGGVSPDGATGDGGGGGPAIDASGTGSADGPDGGGATAATFQLIGRADTTSPAAPRFAWSGTGARVRFHGSRLDVTLDDTGANQLAVTVDGAAPTLLATTGKHGTYTIASGLPVADHDVTLAKRTEAFVGTITLGGFAAPGGAIVPIPPPFARAIEVVGDSITCGYGVLGANQSCSFSPQTEDATVAYAMLAARALDAAPYLVAWSGKGMWRNNDGSTDEPMPVLWTRTLPEDASSRWTFTRIPDVVVVNLGTNDFAKGDPGPPFVTAYEAFLAQLRAHYPAAHVIAAIGPMLNDNGGALTKQRGYVQQVVAARNAAGDAKVTFLEFPMQDGSKGFGCDWHPSAATHQAMADQLVKAVKSITGW